MAKAAVKKSVGRAAKSPEPGRRPAASKTKTAAKTVTPPKKLPSVKAPVVSKDELRAQLEKAQTTIATLRTKAREATRAAKASAAQIAELEASVAKLEKNSASQQQRAPQFTTAVKPAKRGRKVVKKADSNAQVESTDPDPIENETSAAD
jgi:hypothetical protein